MFYYLYIDPGSGFLFAQILTAIVGVIALAKNKILSLRNIFKKKDAAD